MNEGTIPTTAINAWIQRFVSVATLATSVIVGLDLDGPLRQSTTLVFVLVAPGLAATLLMGPMALEARALIAVTGSASLATVVAVMQLVTDLWSGRAGFFAIAVVTQALLIMSFRHTDDDDRSEPIEGAP